MRCARVMVSLRVLSQPVELMTFSFAAKSEIGVKNNKAAWKCQIVYNVIFYTPSSFE